MSDTIPVVSIELSPLIPRLVVHASVGLSREGLLEQCNTVLASAGSRLFQVPLAALQPMRTRTVGKQLWHLQLDSGEAKHALFGKSRVFRGLGIRDSSLRVDVA